MTWNTNCAKTTRAPKQPLRVESVRGVRFPRSYLNMGQPNRVASRRLLIPPSWVGCSYSVQLKNRWIPPPPQKKISTQIVPLIMEAHTTLPVCAQLFGVLVTSKKCPACVCRRSGMVPTLESSWEQIRQWPAVLYLHWRRRSHRLAQSRSEQAKRSALSPRLSPSLSHGRHYFISSMFVWYSSSALRIAPQALHHWANFSAPLQTKSWSRSHRRVRTFGLFCNSDENVFNKHTQVPELHVTLWKNKTKSDVLLNMSTCFSAVFFTRNLLFRHCGYSHLKKKVSSLSIHHPYTHPSVYMS